VASHLVKVAATSAGSRWLISGMGPEHIEGDLPGF